MRHDPCILSTHVMSSAEHEVGLWEGRLAGAVQRFAQTKMHNTELRVTIWTSELCCLL